MKDKLTTIEKHLRENEEFKKRVVAQYLVSQVLVNAKDRSTDYENIISILAETYNWQVGFFWSLSEKDKTLKFYSSWCEPVMDLQNFVNKSKYYSFREGEGYAGKVWKEKKPLWITDINKSHIYIRKEEIMKLGMNSVFGFPVKSKGRVVGVFEFYSKEKRDRDIEKITDSISFQIGQYIRSKETEKALLENAKQMKALFKNIPDGITVEDVNGNIIYANQEAATIFNYKKILKLQKQNIRNVFSKFILRDKDGKELTYKDLPAYKTFTNRRNTSLTVNLIGKGLSVNRWYAVKASIVNNGEVENPLVVKVFRDVTRQIIEQKEREVFLGLVSHEFRSPLASMKAYVQLIQRRLIKSNYKEVPEFIDSIDEQIDRLVKLINNWLDATRVSAGILKLNKKKFNYDELVERVVKNFSVGAKKEAVVVKGEAKSTVYADEDRISQILINLLSNALKYSPKGRKIIVKIKRENKQIITSIKDFGLGIPEDKQEEIFKLYKKADTSKSSKGLGMGLYISASIVKAHKGDIGVISKEGKGSTFTFSLPIKTSKKK